MLGKVQKKLAEFSQAENKSAWLYDQWKWRYFHYKHKQQAQLNLAWDREHGVETAGVGEWPGTVERLQAPIVPHMGWNTVSPGTGSILFAGLDPQTRFYFVHSYAVRRWELVVTDPFVPPVVTWAEHGGDRFIAAVENGPLAATQFHPEKSGDAGAEVLRRWVASI